MNFSQALDNIKKGKEVYRSEWEEQSTIMKIDCYEKIAKVTLMVDDYGVRTYKVKHDWKPDNEDLFAEDWKLAPKNTANDYD